MFLRSLHEERYQIPKSRISLIPRTRSSHIPHEELSDHTHEELLRFSSYEKRTDDAS